MIEAIAKSESKPVKGGVACSAIIRKRSVQDSPQPGEGGQGGEGGEMRANAGVCLSHKLLGRGEETT